MDKLKPVSALQAEYVPGVYGKQSQSPIELQEQLGLTMWNLAVFDDDLASQEMLVKTGLRLPEPGHSVGSDDLSIFWIGPDRYLIVSAASSNQLAYADLADSSTSFALQDLSSARVVIRIKTERYKQLFAKGLNVNLDDFSPGQVIMSSFDHHYPAIIQAAQNTPDEVNVFVTRSLALSFWHWLCDSALEYGYQVIEPRHHG